MLLEREDYTMGLFSPNYIKPGPGISKDAPKKKGIFLYFEILARKIFKLYQASWLYCVCSIPYLVIMFFYTSHIFGGYIGQLSESAVESGIVSSVDINLIIFIISCLMTVSVFTLWGAGPASAGYAYVTRCFTREEHAWILSDFFSKMKENFKQSMLVVVMDFAFLFLIANAFAQYWSMYNTQNQFIWLILLYVCVLILFVYTFMHFNIYQVMVTYDCKMRDLFKNSILLGLGRAPVNLILIVLSLALYVVAFHYLQPLVAVFVILVGLFGFLRFPVEFNSARMIEKIVHNSSEEK